MATETEIERALNTAGIYMEILPDSGLPRATYYKPNGEAMPNLPADVTSMSSYLARGFTLTPPQEKKNKKNKPRCIICGFEATKRVLGQHMMIHTTLGG